MVYCILEPILHLFFASVFFVANDFFSHSFENIATVSRLTLMVSTWVCISILGFHFFFQRNKYSHRCSTAGGAVVHSPNFEPFPKLLPQVSHTHTHTQHTRLAECSIVLLAFQFHRFDLMRPFFLLYIITRFWFVIFSFIFFSIRSTTSACYVHCDSFSFWVGARHRYLWKTSKMCVPLGLTMWRWTCSCGSFHFLQDLPCKILTQLLRRRVAVRRTPDTLSVLLCVFNMFYWHGYIG